MSPLPSPEERRKRLKSLSLEEVLGRDRRAHRDGAASRPPAGPRPSGASRSSAGPRPFAGRHRSAAAEEREQQRREALRRSRSGSVG